MLLNAILEVLSLATIIPFLSLLINPEEINSNKYINILRNSLNIYNNDNLLIFISISLFLIITISTIIRLINLRYSNFLSARIGIDLSTRIFTSNLNDSYISQKSRNSSDIITTNTYRIEQTILVINAILSMVSSIIISLFIFFSLIYINIKVSIATLFIYSSSYYFLAIKTKENFLLIARLFPKKSGEEVKIIQESFGSIKDIFLHNAQNYYLNLFESNVSRLRLKQAENSFLSTYPKFPLESIEYINLFNRPNTLT